ncbi:hypothetical protein FRB94_011942 [Tulasnella sp. JGI-2019a]|nr:hypothetical protein FRB94_011942 [Tulasnella sp. JGI-2019a]KAG8999068.1 hypothetical protein FRB93_013338 [Tulasnella sp. JGI-2019a]
MNSTAIDPTLLATLLNALNGTSLVLPVGSSLIGSADYTAIAAAYCGYNGPPFFNQCLGICPNADVSGIGVRYSFYFNSVANAVLVAVSPSDAAAGAWSSTILTAALIGPALLQKAQVNMTLHHAYIVAGLGTLSSVSSLATAPMVPIWRGRRQATRLDAVYAIDDAESERGRVVLAVALMIQIVLVFAWVTLLFVNPQYAQPECSGITLLVWLGGSQTASYIDKHNYAGWVTWLFSYAAVTAAFGVVMVYSCQSKVHDSPRESLTGWRFWFKDWWAGVDHDSHYRIRIAILGSKCVAGLIVLAYAMMAEWQIHLNRKMILPAPGGEDRIGNFSQAAAVLLSISPLWPLWMAWSDIRQHNDPANHGAHQQEGSGASSNEGQFGSAVVMLAPSPHDNPNNTEASRYHFLEVATAQSRYAQVSSEDLDSESGTSATGQSHGSRSGQRRGHLANGSEISLISEAMQPASV